MALTPRATKGSRLTIAELDDAFNTLDTTKQAALGYVPVNKAGDTGIGTLAISNTTASTSTTTGSLVTAGGVGVGGSLYAGSVTSTGGNFYTGTSLNLKPYGSTAQGVQILPETSVTLNGWYGLKIAPTYNQTGTAAATDLLINRTETSVGSGAQLLIDAQVGGTSKFSVSNTGQALFKGATAGVGYGTGAGGAVTQATSRTTGVTLNNVCGAITLVSAAGSAIWQSFTLTNSAIAATDVVIVNQKSGADLYEIHVTNVAAGSCQITYRTTGGTTTEQPVFNFAVIKAVAA